MVSGEYAERCRAQGMFDGAFSTGGIEAVEKLLARLRKQRGPAESYAKEDLDIHVKVVEELLDIFKE